MPKCYECDAAHDLSEGVPPGWGIIGFDPASGVVDAPTEPIHLCPGHWGSIMANLMPQIMKQAGRKEHSA